jgi:hypothetical protein
MSSATRSFASDEGTKLTTDEGLVPAAMNSTISSYALIMT